MKKSIRKIEIKKSQKKQSKRVKITQKKRVKKE